MKKLVSLLLTILSLSGLASSETLYVAIQSGKLNIRETPKGKISGYLYMGDSVTAAEEKDGWTMVTGVTELGFGWVKSDYLTSDPSASGRYRNTSGGRLHVRETPDGKHVRWIPAGAVISVTVQREDADGGRWGFIGDGYVALSFMERVD